MNINKNRFTFRTYTQTYIFSYNCHQAWRDNVREIQLKHTQQTNKQTKHSITQRRRFNWYEKKVKQNKCEEWKRKESKGKQTNKQEISERHTNFIWRQFFVTGKLSSNNTRKQKHYNKAKQKIPLNKKRGKNGEKK